MKITRIFAHRVELPLIKGSYKWSGGKSVSVFDSTIVGQHRLDAARGDARCASCPRLRDIDVYIELGKRLVEVA